MNNVVIPFNQLTQQQQCEIVHIENQCHTPPWSKQSLLNHHSLHSELQYQYALINPINNTILGYSILMATDIINHEYELLNLTVNPLHQKQGLGYYILTEIFKIIACAKPLTVFLEVRESNDIAINLYKKIGFKIIHRRKQYYLKDALTHSREDGLIMKYNQ